MLTVWMVVSNGRCETTDRNNYSFRVGCADEEEMDVKKNGVI